MFYKFLVVFGLGLWVRSENKGRGRLWRGGGLGIVSV